MVKSKCVFHIRDVWQDEPRHMNNWTHYFLTTKYLPKPLQVPWFEDDENDSGVRVVVDGIWEDGFRVRKAESRPPPNILFVPYHRAIIHPAEDTGTETPVTAPPVFLHVQWLPRLQIVCRTDTVSGDRKVYQPSTYRSCYTAEEQLPGALTL